MRQNSIFYLENKDGMLPETDATQQLLEVRAARAQHNLDSLNH